MWHVESSANMSIIHALYLVRILSVRSTHTILILSCSGPQAYKIRIILSFRGLPRATSSLIKTNSCLTQSYPVICEVLQAEVRPQIISTPFYRAVMLIGTDLDKCFCY